MSRWPVRRSGRDQVAPSAAGTSPRIPREPRRRRDVKATLSPLPRFLESGLTVGLGTDGCASNNNQDLFREMDMAAKLHKLAAGDPTVVPAATALQMATIDGARAIGLGEVVGSLEVGKRADIIILDSRHPRLRPMFNPVSQAVYAAGADCVRDTIVDGRIRVRHRDLVGWDLETLIEPVASVARDIAPGAAQPIQKGEGLNER